MNRLKVKNKTKNKGRHARTRGMIRAAREIGSSIPAGSTATFHLIVLQQFLKKTDKSSVTSVG